MGEVIVFKKRKIENTHSEGADVTSREYNIEQSYVKKDLDTKVTILTIIQ